MTPILDLQQRLVEAGRIRTGASTPGQSGRKVPKKLETFRLTSRERGRIEAAAKLFGGTVQQWEGQWEVYTETNEIPCLIPPGAQFSQWYELWSGGGCTRRCDGQREYLSDGPCLCPGEYDEKRELASKGKACKPTTRLNVILPDVPGIGVWRLESHGYYAAVELSTMVRLIEQASQDGILKPAVIRLEARSRLVDGRTNHYFVPVIDIPMTPRELTGGAQPELERPPFQPVPKPAAAPRGVAAAVASVEGAKPDPAAPRSRAQAELGPATPPPAPDDFDVPASVIDGDPGPEEEPPPAQNPAGDEPEATDTTSGAFVPPPGWDDPNRQEGADVGGEEINEGQRRRLWAIAREHGVETPAVRQIIVEITGEETTKMPRRHYDAVIEKIQTAGGAA